MLTIGSLLIAVIDSSFSHCLKALATLIIDWRIQHLHCEALFTVGIAPVLVQQPREIKDLNERLTPDMTPEG